MLNDQCAHVILTDISVVYISDSLLKCFNFLSMEVLVKLNRGMSLCLHSVPKWIIKKKSIPDGTLHQIGEGLRKKSVNDSAQPLLIQQHDGDPTPVQMTPTLSHVPLLFEEDEEVSGRGLG